jgi:hypothetical protein
MKTANSRTIRNVRYTLGCVALTALAACSSSPPLFLSDGRQTTVVQCRDGSDSCMQQARAACGTDIEVVSQSTTNGTLNLIYACRNK